jgi:hypothetical protein
VLTTILCLSLTTEIYYTLNRVKVNISSYSYIDDDICLLYFYYNDEDYSEESVDLDSFDESKLSLIVNSIIQ